MKIIHCKSFRFLSMEGLFRYMIRNNLKSVKYRIEEHGRKGKQIVNTYEEVKEHLREEKYDVDEIVRNEFQIKT